MCCVYSEAQRASFIRQAIVVPHGPHVHRPHQANIPANVQRQRRLPVSAGAANLSATQKPGDNHPWWLSEIEAFDGLDAAATWAFGLLASCRWVGLRSRSRHMRAGGKVCACTRNAHQQGGQDIHIGAQLLEAKSTCSDNSFDGSCTVRCTLIGRLGLRSTHLPLSTRSQVQGAVHAAWQCGD